MLFYFYIYVTNGSVKAFIWNCKFFVLIDQKNKQTNSKLLRNRIRNENEATNIFYRKLSIPFPLFFFFILQNLKKQTWTWCFFNCKCRFGVTQKLSMIIFYIPFFTFFFFFLNFTWNSTCTVFSFNLGLLFPNGYCWKNKKKIDRIKETTANKFSWRF